MRQLVYTMFINYNRLSFHLGWKKNLLKHQRVSKIMKIIVGFVLGGFLACFVWFFLVLRQFRYIFGLFWVVLIQSRVILAPFGSLWVNIGFLLDRLCWVWFYIVSFRVILVLFLAGFTFFLFFYFYFSVWFWIVLSQFRSTVSSFWFVLGSFRLF